MGSLPLLASRGLTPARAGDEQGRVSRLTSGATVPGVLVGEVSRTRDWKDSHGCEPACDADSGSTRPQATSGPATESAEPGHNRTEQRIPRTVTVTDDTGIKFSHTAHLFRATRYIGDLNEQHRTTQSPP